MNISLLGVGVSSIVAALDIGTEEIPELKKDLVTLPNGTTINSQDASRIGIAAVGAIADVASRDGSETGAVLFYSETPLVMKTIKKIAGI